MDPGEMTLFSSGVWLIPLILLVIMGGLFLLVRHWQKRTAQEQKEMRARLRQFYTWRRQIEAVLQPHAPNDPEPYGSRITALRDQLPQVDRQATQLENMNVALNERTRRLAGNRWRATVAAPYYWYQVRQDMTRLQEQGAQLQQSLEQVEGWMRGLDNLGWDVAQRARRVRDVLKQVTGYIDQFRSRKIHGDTLDEITRQQQGYQDQLRQINSSLLNGDRQSVLERASKEDIIRAYEVNEAAIPALEVLLMDLQAWEQQYADAVEQVGWMRQQLVALEHGLLDVSPGLDASDFKAQFARLSEISNTLHATLSRLELENMTGVAQEAERVGQSAKEMEEQLQRARQRRSILETSLSELSASMKQLSALFASLAASSTHPILWTQSREQLMYLSRESSALGSGEKSRTPQQVDQDMASAARLNAQLQELTRYCQQIAQQHDDLLALLSSPELGQGRAWLHNAQGLVSQVELYDVENWPRLDGAATLRADLQALNEQLQRLVFSNPAEPIPETSLQPRLEEVQRLVQRYRDFSTRLKNIGARLAEIRDSEKSAGEQLDRARAVLTQVSFLARSNQFLEHIASGEIGRLQGSLEQLNKELEQRQRGSVDKKARLVDALYKKIEQASLDWAERLGKEIQAQRQALGEHLANLEDVGTVDEAAVSEARRLLAAGQAFGKGSLALKGRLGLDEIALEIKNRSEYWQSCEAALRKIEDVEQPVLDTYETASTKREAARQQLADLALSVRGKRAWPPVSVDLEAERKGLAQLEEQWQALKQQPLKAIALVSQLGAMATRYQALSEKMHLAEQRAEHDVNQFHQLEVDLDDLARRWQNQWRAYRQLPEAGESIQKILVAAEQERQRLQRQYRQGAISYEQVIQGMTDLRHHLNTVYAPLDAARQVNVDGRERP